MGEKKLEFMTVWTDKTGQSKIFWPQSIYSDKSSQNKSSPLTPMRLVSSQDLFYLDKSNILTQYQELIDKNDKITYKYVSVK